MMFTRLHLTTSWMCVYTMQLAVTYTIIFLLQSVEWIQHVQFMQPIIQPCARCKQTYNRLKLWMHYANESSQVGTFGQNFEKKNLFWKTNHGFLIVKTPVKCYQALKCPTITLWLTSLQGAQWGNNGMSGVSKPRRWAWWRYLFLRDCVLHWLQAYMCKKTHD